jgi:Uma2 family endonuclease
MSAVTSVCLSRPKERAKPLPSSRVCESDCLCWDKTEHAPILSAPTPIRLKVSDHLTLDAAGALGSYGRTELINGKPYAMNAQHRPCAPIKSRLSVSLANIIKALGLPLEMMVEATVEMEPLTAPEPDIILTSAAEGDDLVRFDSVALMVEISDASLQHDLHRKADLYLRFNVPEYWIVDVKARACTRCGIPAGQLS